MNEPERHIRLIENVADLHAMRDALNNEGARHVFLRILEITGIRHDTFDPDPYIHAQRAGFKALGLQLEEALLQAAPNIYMSLIRSPE
jgi:hypothetical protein